MFPTARNTMAQDVEAMICNEGLTRLVPMTVSSSYVNSPDFGPDNICLDKDQDEVGIGEFIRKKDRICFCFAWKCPY